jgi:mannose-1-phosphate guanylyltransferase
MYAVILAGGGGTRLWPLSRPECPKPFLPLLDERSLLELTVERLPEQIDRRRDVYVVTDRRYWDLVEALVPQARVLPEPAGRNTAAAVAFAAAAIERPDDDVMLVLPADHRIDDVEGYQRILLAAAEGLAPGAMGVELPLVTLGVRPTRPDTGFGYIRPSLANATTISVPGAAEAEMTAFPVQSFEEKPTLERAEHLLALGGVAWNAGTFVWKRAAIRDAFARYSGARRIYEPIATALAMGQQEVLDNAYETVEATSIDYAVLQPAARDGFVLMTPMDVGWSDLGSWASLLEALPGSAGKAVGRVIKSGEVAELRADDLLVTARDGRLSLQPGYDGRLVAEGTVAVISGAQKAQIQALLDRVAAALAGNGPASRPSSARRAGPPTDPAAISSAG